MVVAGVPFCLGVALPSPPNVSPTQHAGCHPNITIALELTTLPAQPGHAATCTGFPCGHPRAPLTADGALVSGRLQQQVGGGWACAGGDRLSGGLRPTPFMGKGIGMKAMRVGTEENESSSHTFLEQG